MKKILPLLFVFLSSLLLGEIFEIKNFDEITQYLKEDTLVLLDIDDTLLVPDQMLGSDEWFQHRVKMYKKNGHAELDAVVKSLHEWKSIRYITKMHLVEPGTATDRE